MIKICFVINFYTNNGPSNVVKNIIDNLDKNVYKISLLTLFDGNDTELIDSLKSDGIEVFICKKANRMACLLGKSPEVFEIINNERYDIIHTHGIIPDILASKLNRDIVKLSTLHCNIYEDYVLNYGKVKGILFAELHRKALSKLDRCICCSKSVYEVMRNKIHKTTFIRNAIAIEPHELSLKRSDLGLDDNDTVYIFVGMLNERKNIVWLIEQFVHQHTDGEKLIVLGMGDKEEECRSVMDEDVLMLGFKENAIEYMMLSNVYVSASQSEGFSISVLEALSVGLRLLLSDIPSHREIIELSGNNTIGELFNDISFKDAMDRIRKNKISKEQIQKFQQDNLTIKMMASDYMEEYEECLRSKKQV